MRDKLASLPQATILQLIYQQKSYEGNARDYEFSAQFHARALEERP